jgi:hypothetical protein
MYSKTLFGLAVSVSLVCGTASRAAEHPSVLPRAAAVTTDLGGKASAVTYWVDTADGWNVVTTVDSVIGDDTESGQARHAVVRFASLLLPGQSQVVSVPQPLGAPSQALHILRLGDRIEVAVVDAPALPDQPRNATN